MMSKVKISICFQFLLLFLFSCKDDLAPSPVRTGEAPDPVTNYQVTPMAGAAMITYDLPSGRDLRYVKAVYQLADGSVRESRSSLYKNFVLVEGFPAAGDYNVNLIAVGVGEVESEPRPITIEVQTPPYLQVLNTLREEDNLSATFGGLRLEFANETEAAIAMHIVSRRDGEQWQNTTTHYTRAPNGILNIRGFESEQRDFGIYITDRWNNRSDTVVATVTPLFEQMMNKALFREYNLATDEYTGHSNFGSVRALWDNVIQGGSSNLFHTRPGTGIPQHFTFDMGVAASLNRFVMFARYDHEYRFNHPRRFELYGSNAPGSDGGWDSWTLVGTYESIKPSGLPLGQQSADDLTYARAGEEFEVDAQNQSFRYWRWRTMDTWGGNSDVAIAELSFFGEIIE